VPGSIKYKWDKDKRNTVIDKIITREKGTKGPADYDTWHKNKKKVVGQYTDAVPTGGFINETAYLSAQTPAPSKYDSHLAKDRIGSRSPVASLKRDGKPIREILIPYSKLKTNDPNPFTYKGIDKDWKNLAGKDKEVRQIWNKEKSGTWLEKHQKSKKAIPGPGHREPSIEQVKMCSTGTYNNQRRR